MIILINRMANGGSQVMYPVYAFFNT